MIKPEQGFTIIETMIFLAISGVTFAMAVIMLGNQQRSTQFSQAVRELESSLNDIANDTSTGVFPDVGGVRCVVGTGGGAPSISFTPAPNTQSGQNNDCIFVGNVVQLIDADANGDASNYFVHVLVGINDPESRSFLDTAPVPMYSVSGGDPTVADFGEAATRSLSIPWGTKIKRAYYTPDTGPLIYVRGIGYVYSNFGTRLSNVNFTSGAASVSLYAVVAGSSPEFEDSSTLNREDFRASINTQNPSNPSEYRIISDKITLCLEGVGGREAMIEIGGEGGSVSARTNFDISEECRD